MKLYITIHIPGLGETPNLFVGLSRETRDQKVLAYLQQRLDDYDGEDEAADARTRCQQAITAGDATAAKDAFVEWQTDHTEEFVDVTEDLPTEKQGRLNLDEAKILYLSATKVLEGTPTDRVAHVAVRDLAYTLIQHLEPTYDPNMTPDQRWYDNSIQFMRLLSEFHAQDLSRELVEAMAESMDLTFNQVWELLDRADREWEHYKSTIPSDV